MPRNRTSAATSRAQVARKERSVAEAIMWTSLRDRKIGFKFRREHPIGPYRLDFYCAEAMLAVEMDGEQHDAARDAKRDSYLAELGILTYRIANRRFFGLDDEAYRDDLGAIAELCRARIG